MKNKKAGLFFLLMSFSTAMFSQSNIEKKFYEDLKTEASYWKALPKQEIAPMVLLLEQMSNDSVFEGHDAFKKSCQNSKKFIERILESDLSIENEKKYIKDNAESWSLWQKKINVYVDNVEKFEQISPYYSVMQPYVDFKNTYEEKQDDLLVRVMLIAGLFEQTFSNKSNIGWLEQFNNLNSVQISDKKLKPIVENITSLLVKISQTENQAKKMRLIQYNKGAFYSWMCFLGKDNNFDRYMNVLHEALIAKRNNINAGQMLLDTDSVMPVSDISESDIQESNSL